MRTVLPAIVLALGISVLAANEPGLQPACEVRHDSSEDREKADRQAREIVLKHLIAKDGGFRAEDRLENRGEAFRIGYAIEDFCSKGDELMFVFHLSFRTPGQVRQIYLVNLTKQRVRPIR